MLPNAKQTRWDSRKLRISHHPSMEGLWLSFPHSRTGVPPARRVLAQIRFRQANTRPDSRKSRGIVLSTAARRHGYSTAARWRW
jgi:hypothetical protein